MAICAAALRLSKGANRDPYCPNGQRLRNARAVEGPNSLLASGGRLLHFG
jgi:hypothetical protein